MADLPSVTFPADGSVLDSVRLELRDDEHLALFGPNGAGKSSLLRGLAGTLPGQDRRSDVAYLPQSTHLFRGTGRANLGIGDGDPGVAESLCRTFGVDDILDRDVAELSLGQRQRIAIARVLAGDEPIVLLDEPLAPIDTADRRVVIGAIRARCADRSLVCVTHSVADAAALADTLAIMDDGNVVQRGPVPDVLSHPRSARVASIIGVSNVLEGRVTGSDGRLSTVDVGGVELSVPADLAAGEMALVRVGAESIVVYGERPVGGSHRTVIEGVIQGIEPAGALVEIHLSGPVEVTALLTEGSIETLGLAVGGSAWFGIKAAAVSLIWSG